MSNGSYPNSEQGIEDMLHAHEYGLNVRGLSVAGQDAHPIKWNNVSGLPLATPDIGGTFAANTTRHQIQLYRVSSCLHNVVLYIVPFSLSDDDIESESKFRNITNAGMRHIAFLARLCRPPGATSPTASVR